MLSLESSETASIALRQGCEASRSGHNYWGQRDRDGYVYIYSCEVQRLAAKDEHSIETHRNTRPIPYITTARPQEVSSNMTWTSKAILALVELIIYAALTPVTIYTLYKHRLPSLVGHVFLYAFILPRVIADRLTIHDHNVSTGVNETAAIVNSIGVSPLLLATAGFINESRHYICDYAHNEHAKKTGWIFELLLHVMLVGGIALLAVGDSKAATAATSSDINAYRALAYVGAILLLVAWLSICVWACQTFWVSSKQKKSGAPNCIARTLITEVLVSLPFSGVRVCYSIAYTFDQSRSLYPATAGFLVDFFLIFLVQLVAALVLVVGLFVTRKIGYTVGAEVEDGHRSAETMLQSVKA